jgi:hypothetical protein
MIKSHSLTEEWLRKLRPVREEGRKFEMMPGTDFLKKYSYNSI